MNITVAICTWNRADLLSKTLENMLRLKIDDSFSWELIVVNNNCTDGTDKVIQAFVARLPIKRIFEPTPGLSNARNAAVCNAGGDYIIWTDDDVLVDSDWLLAYVRAFREWPGAAVFGGPIEPWFEGRAPGWLMEGWQIVADAFAVRDLGNEPIALSVAGNLLPYGANFAIKMSEQVRYLYDPKLGLSAGKILLGEETQVISSILFEGFEGRWVPDARVKHWLPISRQTLSYLKRYYIGRGKSIILSGECLYSARIFGFSRWRLREILLSYVVFVYKRAFSPARIWLKHFVSVYVDIGKIIADRSIVKN